MRKLRSATGANNLVSIAAIVAIGWALVEPDHDSVVGRSMADRAAVMAQDEPPPIATCVPLTTPFPPSPIHFPLVVANAG